MVLELSDIHRGFQPFHFYEIPVPFQLYDVVDLLQECAAAVVVSPKILVNEDLECLEKLVEDMFQQPAALLRIDAFTEKPRQTLVHMLDLDPPFLEGTLLGEAPISFQLQIALALQLDLRDPILGLNRFAKLCDERLGLQAVIIPTRIEGSELDHTLQELATRPQSVVTTRVELGQNPEHDLAFCDRCFIRFDDKIDLSEVTVGNAGAAKEDQHVALRLA